MTNRQRTLFFGLFARACEAQGIYGEQARDAFRHELIARVLPLSGGSLRNIGKGRDFDKLMAELSRLAQSAEASAHFATAEGRRWAYFIEAAARQVCELSAVRASMAEEPSQPPIAYIKGILVQAKWHWALAARGGEWWLDLTQVHEEKLFQMLDTHRRRLLRAIPLEKSEADGTRLRAGFDPDAAYRRVGNRLVRVVGTTEPAVLHCTFEATQDFATTSPSIARSYVKKNTKGTKSSHYVRRAASRPENAKFASSDH